MQRWTADTDCSFAVKFWILSCFSNGVVSDVEVYKTDTSEVMEVVCKFFYFEIIILTCISVLTSFFWIVIFC